MRWAFLFLALICIPVGAGAQNSENPEAHLFRFGVFSETFEGLSHNDALAAIKAWGNTVIKEHHINAQVDVTWYDSLTTLHRSLQNDQVDAFSVRVEDCIRLGIMPDFIFLLAGEDAFEVRYNLLIHQNSPIRDIETLAGRSLSLSRGNQMVMAELWMKSLLAGEPLNSNSLDIINMIRVNRPSKAILQVFFQQADAAVVTESAFEVACELNPQLKKDIRVLAVSPPLINSFFVFRQNWQGSVKKELESALVGLHNTPGGRQILNVFQSARMRKLPGTVLEGTRRFVLKHLQDLDDFSIKEPAP